VSVGQSDADVNPCAADQHDKDKRKWHSHLRQLVKHHAPVVAVRVVACDPVTPVGDVRMVDA
jgi:hypothetical protein